MQQTIRALALALGVSVGVMSPASAGAADLSSSGDEVFKTAVAAWQMAGPSDASGKSELKVVGAVTLEIKRVDQIEITTAGKRRNVISYVSRRQA